MHYMIGTEIVVNEQAPSVDNEMSLTGIRSVSDMRPTKPKIKRANTTPFLSNTKYTLINIRPIKSKVEYRFRTSTGEEYVIQFSSTAEADACISHALNEPLPDYGSFHRSKSF